LNKGRRKKVVTEIAIFNLTEEELKDEEKIGEITQAVIEAILSVPQIELSERDIFFTFPQVSLEIKEIVSVMIFEESFFQSQRGMNLEVRLGVYRRVSAALKPILGRDGRHISVDIRRPKPK